MQNPDRIQLTMEQAALLERHGCTCPDWNRVRISPDTDLRLIRFCRFYGDVSIGSLYVVLKLPRVCITPSLPIAI